MEAKDWLAIVFGIILIAAGIVIFSKRKWILQATIDGQGALFGRRAGKTMARNSSSGSIAFVGIGAVIMGVALIVITTLIRIFHHA